MADELGAVRRTARLTVDHQIPETVAQLPRGATNTALPVSGDHQDVSSRVTSRGEPAPLAVHFAGPAVRAEGRRSQLCMWCGHVLSDLPSRKGETLPEPWESGVLVRIEDGDATVVPYDGGELPPGCCALPDDGEPVCICTVESTPCPDCRDEDQADDDVPVDPDDGYPVDLCGKHTGNCSNRCLLPAHHADECDDDPHPDEAQEARAATDWPAEPVDAVEVARRQGVDLYEETAGYHPNTGEPHDPVVRGG